MNFIMNFQKTTCQSIPKEIVATLVFEINNSQKYIQIHFQRIFPLKFTDISETISK